MRTPDSVSRSTVGSLSPAAASTPASSTNRAQGAAPVAPVPEPAGQSNKAYDGKLLGGDGRFYSPSTRVEDLPAVRPSNGAEPKGTTIFVNGVGGKPDGVLNQMQQYANASGNQVVGVYNATEGFVKDIFQSGKDKFDLGKNPAVDTLADLIYSKVTAGENVQVMGYSQGGLITSRALEDVRNRLMLEGGMSKGEAEQAMSRITVETVAGAGSHFVDGPKYTHYVNKADVVPNLFGVRSPFSDPGRGAEIRTFNTWNPFSAHNFDKYMARWSPPNQSNGT
jgi:hypothetical protein